MANRKYSFIVALFLFVILGDWFVGKVLEAGFFSKQSIENDRVVHAFSGTEADLLVFGSSRALHHYNTELIQDSLNITAFNVAEGGQNIYYHNLLLKTVLNRYKPKKIILELFYIDFEETSSNWDKEKLAVLLPFSKKHETVQNAFMNIDPNHRFKIFSRIYPFNSEVYRIFRNNFAPYHNSYHGFMPIAEQNGLDLNEQPLEIKSSAILDANKVAEVELFITSCLNSDIDLKVVVSPSYCLYEKGNSYEEFIAYLQRKFPIDVCSFQNDAFFSGHPELFKDVNHLNTKGANEFTKRIFSIIK